MVKVWSCVGFHSNTRKFPEIFLEISWNKNGSVNGSKEESFGVVWVFTAVLRNFLKFSWKFSRNRKKRGHNSFPHAVLRHGRVRHPSGTECVP
jgi:hypothetical protein